MRTDGSPGAPDLVARALAAAKAQSDLGAFWSLSRERALSRADQVGGAGISGGLAGVPVAIKDNFDLAGLPTTGGLWGEHPPAAQDAEAVSRLEAAGAVAIGKTAMDTLAWGTHGQAEGFPGCRNPRWPERSPGGSSAGSAVAVAAGIVPLALGSDTAGSVRIPAAYCEVVGVKLAHDSALLEGCLPLAPSFDSVGVLGESVSACGTACSALLGTSPTWDEEAIGEPTGVLTDLLDDSDEAVARPCRTAIENAGIDADPVTLGWRAPELGLLLAAEFATAWGARAAAEPERFPQHILRAIDDAREIDPVRRQAVLDALARARSDLERRLGRFAALLCPTVPTAVPTVDAENVATSTRFTRIFSALGWPAISVPCGRDDEGRPVGLHITASGGLGPLLAVAARIERSRTAS